MNRFLKLGFASLLSLSLISCATVPAGYVGVKTKQLGSDAGVQEKPLPVGRHGINFLSEEVYIFPVFDQIVTFEKTEDDDTSVTFTSTEGATFNADITVTFGYGSEKTPLLYKSYRLSPDDFEQNYIRRILTDSINRAASDMTAVDIFGREKSLLLEETLTLMQNTINANLSEKGQDLDGAINIISLSFANTPRPSQRVQESIEQVITRKQKALEAQEEVREAKARAKADVARAQGEAEAEVAEAKGHAEANKLITESLSKELIEYQKTQKWNGELPKVTGESAPMIELND